MPRPGTPISEVLQTNIGVRSKRCSVVKCPLGNTVSDRPQSAPKPAPESWHSMADWMFRGDTSKTAAEGDGLRVGSSELLSELVPHFLSIFVVCQ